jgi:hypothetical protein
MFQQKHSLRGFAGMNLANMILLEIKSLLIWDIST